MPPPLNPQAEVTKLVRASILTGALQLFPNTCMKSTLRYLVEDLNIRESQLDRELAYLKIRGWIKTEPTTLLGREDTRIELTPDGVDVASGIDPANPLGAEI